MYIDLNKYIKSLKVKRMPHDMYVALVALNRLLVKVFLIGLFSVPFSTSNWLKLDDANTLVDISLYIVSLFEVFNTLILVLTLNFVIIFPCFCCIPRDQEIMYNVCAVHQFVL